MFNRSGKSFLGSFGVALFALLLNFTLPASIAIAAEDGSAGYLLEVCSSSGVKAIQIDGGDLATDSVSANDHATTNHSLCSYCSIHHGGASVDPGLLSFVVTHATLDSIWFVTPASASWHAVLDLSMPTRGPPRA